MRACVRACVRACIWACIWACSLSSEKDVIDQLDNENVIAIIDKPEVADNFVDAGDDNTFTPIVLGDIDVSEAIDVNATKPIVVDTIDKVDEVEKEIKASQGKDVCVIS